MAGNVDLDVRNLQGKFHALDAGYRELFDFVMEMEKLLELVAEGKDISEEMATLKTRKPRKR
jgi:hypothetical protein